MYFLGTSWQFELSSNEGPWPKFAACDPNRPSWNSRARSCFGYEVLLNSLGKVRLHWETLTSCKARREWSAHPGGSDLPYENMQRPSYHKVTWGWMCCSAWHCATVCVPLCPMFWTWVVGHCWCVNLCSASFSLFFCRYVETTSDLTDSTESVAIPGDQTMSLKHIWPHASLPGRWNSDWRSEGHRCRLMVDLLIPT